MTWQAVEEYDGCEVTPEGLFTATAEGEYEVQVKLHDVLSNTVKIRVEAPSEIRKIEMDDIIGGESPLAPFVLDPDAVNRFDLFGDDSTVTFMITDQYGEEIYQCRKTVLCNDSHSIES